MPNCTKKIKSLLSNLQKANEVRHSKASKFDLSLQEAQEIPVNIDFSLENSSIVDLPLSSPELSDDDEIIDLGTLEYDNEIANVNFFEDNNAGETSNKKIVKVIIQELLPEQLDIKNKNFVKLLKEQQISWTFLSQ